MVLGLYLGSRGFGEEREEVTPLKSLSDRWHRRRRPAVGVAPPEHDREGTTIAGRRGHTVERESGMSGERGERESYLGLVRIRKENGPHGN